jgi:hypothetical protein
LHGPEVVSELPAHGKRCDGSECNFTVVSPPAFNLMDEAQKEKLVGGC